jgi:hypothetical protein
MSQTNPTPLGPIGFAMELVKESDGSIHGRVQSDKETYFDFRFYRGEKGQILFRETGALGDGFVQSHEMEVVKRDGDTQTFSTKEQPPLLVATVTAGGDRLRLTATVRGKPHVDLDMARVRDEKAIAKFQADQARARDLPGGSALQQFFAAAAAKTVDGSLPKAGQARLHLAESRKLAEQMAGANQSEVGRLALLSKGHLDKAIELDPSLDEAQYALAMWYLQTPELAARSQAKVNEILALLDRMNSPLAKSLRNKLTGRN